MFLLFFFNDTATTEIYTLSLHDALPIYEAPEELREQARAPAGLHRSEDQGHQARLNEDTMAHKKGVGSSQDRKSTRLNSSHLVISYAVFCLKKKIITSTTESDSAAAQYI